MSNVSENAVPDWLIGSVETIFSWVILMPISVIISGKILAKILNFPVDSEQVFKIPIKILNIEAIGGEVILGFAGFIITLTGMGLIAGQEVYLLVKTNFGIDPGQFNSICMLSSFATVIWTSIIFLISEIFSKTSQSPLSDISAEHLELIKLLADKNKGDKNE